MRKIILIISILSAILLFSACNADVVGKIAVTSFDKIQQKAQVTKTESQTAIKSPTGNIFEYGPSGTSMKLPLKPFVDAGLDTNKLPSYIVLENDMLVIKQDYKAADFKTFVENYRDKIGYHEVLDHYGIDMGNGNKFEWAKDIEKNDKDVVFVLNPEPLKNAGVNVEKVEGFAYAEVEVKKGVKEFKLLAPYDLNNATAKATENDAVPTQTPSATPADNVTATTTPDSKKSATSADNVTETAKNTSVAGSPTTTATATPQATTQSTTAPKTGEKFDGIVINKSEVTSTAKFIPYTADGVNMEVFAVKASDGQIRTAFNTCQVCYDSGRGYYIQKGDVFVCQNCGNQFRTSDIEKIKGGCNPVPITSEYKTEDQTSIKIPSTVLASAKTLFSDWKR